MNDETGCSVMNSLYFVLGFEYNVTTIHYDIHILYSQMQRDLCLNDDIKHPGMLSAKYSARKHTQNDGRFCNFVNHSERRKCSANEMHRPQLSVTLSYFAFD